MSATSPAASTLEAQVVGACPRAAWRMPAALGAALIVLACARLAISVALWRHQPAPVPIKPAGYGPNLLLPSRDIDNWTFESFDNHAWGTVSEGDGGIIARCNGADGTDYHFELFQSGYTLDNGRLYALAFAARADRHCRITVAATVDNGNSHDVGLYGLARLGPRWRVYRYEFRAERAQPGHVFAPRFFLGHEPATVWIAHAALREQLESAPQP